MSGPPLLGRSCQVGGSGYERRAVRFDGRVISGKGFESVTMPRWVRLGRVFDPASVLRPHPKLLTHAANPVAISLGGSVVQFLYSGRDDRNRSSVGRVDVDVDSLAVIDVGDFPLLEHGPNESWYRDGIGIGNAFPDGPDTRIGFMAWQSSGLAHWRGDIGVATVIADGSLRVDGDGPWMGLSEDDSVSLSYPWVMARPDGTLDMWYGSTVTWDAGNGEMLHVIKHARRERDGLWRRTGQAIPHVLGSAQAFSRPCVVAGATAPYDMWFSYRAGDGTPYRIGHATSDDGMRWELDRGGTVLDASGTGWDSTMVEYPCVFEHGGRWLMAYNGDGFGRTGIGLAVLE